MPLVKLSYFMLLVLLFLLPVFRLLQRGPRIECPVLGFFRPATAVKECPQFEQRRGDVFPFYPTATILTGSSQVRGSITYE